MKPFPNMRAAVKWAESVATGWIHVSVAVRFPNGVFHFRLDTTIVHGERGLRTMATQE